MVAVVPPAPNPLRRHALRAGTALFATEALDLVNVPGVNPLVHQAHEWIASLKTDMNQPRILQAPENNDQDARELTSRIELYSQLLETAADIINELDTGDQNDSTAANLLQVQEFHEYLSNTRAELQVLQAQCSIVKFACQTEIKSRLDRKHEEILSQAILFCLKNSLLANHTAALFHGKLVSLQTRLFEEMQRSSDERFRRLEYQQPRFEQPRCGLINHEVPAQTDPDQRNLTNQIIM
ncbi:hypothetical protein FRC07_013371 [Ceratobasidium sp. 392]|nr:hypothetical protein FRC07_013371 [Ceratobasidium sp. 392]